MALAVPMISTNRRAFGAAKTPHKCSGEGFVPFGGNYWAQGSV